MKLHFVKYSFLILGFSVAAVGCLKDKQFDDGQIQSIANGNIKVISLGVSVSNTQNFASYAYNASGNDTVVNLIPVELGGPTAAPADIHVTLVENDALVDSFDNNTGNDYAPPTGLFTVVNAGGIVTIPKGSRVGYLQIKFVPNDLIGADYALGYSITAVKESGYTISGNVKDGITAILIKNKYDGTYGMRMRLTGWAAYNISDGPTYSWPSNMFLATTGGASVLIETNEEGTLEPAFGTGGSVSGFGATAAQLTFDPNTNKLISVDNLIPDDGRGRKFAINPAITDSRWDPATGNVYAAYEMFQNTRPIQFIYDTLTYVGPR
jgi:hypothetical protein